MHGITSRPFNLARRKFRSWGYVLGLAGALSLSGSVYVIQVGNPAAVRADGRMQPERPLVPAGQPIDSGMVRIVPFAGDPRMVVGIPFSEPGTVEPGPAPTSAAVPPIRGLHVGLRP